MKQAVKLLQDLLGVERFCEEGDLAQIAHFFNFFILEQAADIGLGRAVRNRRCDRDGGASSKGQVRG